MEIDKLIVTITETADHKRDYIQIMTPDMLSMNIVLIVDNIEVTDHRVNVRKSCG